AGLEFREPSAEFGQLGRREPQDRFLDIFDCHGRRNSTPASELEEPWLANRDVTVFRRPVIEVGKQRVSVGRSPMILFSDRVYYAPSDRTSLPPSDSRLDALIFEIAMR